MSNIQDYFVSTKPAKLMLLDGEGNETGDYLDVISLDAAKVSRARSKWTSETVKLQRELEGINDRSVEDECLNEDLQRKSELLNFAFKDLNVEYSMLLVEGSSFKDVTDADMRELLHNGNIADSVIALSADSDRLKKKA